MYNVGLAEKAMIKSIWYVRTWEYVGSCLFMDVFMSTCMIRYTAIEFKLCHQPVEEYAMKVSGQQINVAVGEQFSCSGT